jgi:hypothetical protein
MHNSQNHLILKDWKKNRVAEGEIKKKIKKKRKNNIPINSTLW